MDDIMKIPFSEVKEDALKQIEDTIRRMGGKGGKRYLEDTCRNDRFDPESVRMSDYCMGDKWDRELLTSIHKSALEINRATGPSDLIEYSSRILNRKVCDSYYGELTALCNGTLLIINDTVYSCCCERFAREIAYGKGFIMRSQFFPVSDGE
ncbi:MAG: hypothetical protein II855_09735, partial [Candidatus Methanomethylophilaceae archaeon]|nr:hypothetical protein [Candidatus Methanomethylophilaceae archaeon]